LFIRIQLYISILFYIILSPVLMILIVFSKIFTKKLPNFCKPINYVITLNFIFLIDMITILKMGQDYNGTILLFKKGNSLFSLYWHCIRNGTLISYLDDIPMSYLKNKFFDIRVLKKIKTKKQNTLLLIRTDAIGDYILFRNFIKSIKESKKYSDFSITLCGNIVWKELTDIIDSEYIDDFIWIDRFRFISDRNYRQDKISTINKQAFLISINPIYSRGFLISDSIIQASMATERIGFSGDKGNANQSLKDISDNYYTKLIESEKNVLFEFDRNKEFVEKLLKAPVEISRTAIDFDLIKNAQNQVSGLPKQYALIFPGGSGEEKKWDTCHYAEVADYISNNYKKTIVICGGKGETESAVNIINQMTSNKVIDVTGKTSLSQFAVIIKKAEILISNDSSSIHFAAAFNVPCVVVLNGIHYGRFSPYPQEKYPNIISIYPEEIQNSEKDLHYLSQKYRYSSEYTVNSIYPSEIKKRIQTLL